MFETSLPRFQCTTGLFIQFSQRRSQVEHQIATESILSLGFTLLMMSAAIFSRRDMPCAAIKAII